MSAIGGIIIFVLGIGAGLGAAVGIVILVKRLTEPLRRANKHLETSAWNDRLEFESRKAFHAGYVRGYRKGRDNPLSDVERLAATLEEHNIDFRTGSTRKRRDG